MTADAIADADADATSANAALAARYIAAAGAGDVDAVGALLEPDVVVWHNHDDAEVDGAAMLRTLGWLHRAVSDVAWVDRGVVAWSGGFVWRSLMTGTGPGGPLHVHTCVVVTSSGNGKVARIEEYLDSASLASMAPARSR